MGKLVVAIGLTCAVGMAGMAIAGNMDPPGLPSAGSNMYTLQQVYDYLTSGTVAPTPGPFHDPSAGPSPTMHTLTEVYAAVATPLQQCDAAAADVKSGKKFFCTQAGSWGVQTGVWVIPTMTPTQTPTSTPTQTPTQTPTPDWYAKYGPSGENKVVKIGSIYVAKWTDNPGTDNNAAKNWDTATSWATNLNWLERTVWRLPTRAELDAICASKSDLGSYSTNTGYWSSTPYASSSVYTRVFDACTEQTMATSSSKYVRAVRSSY